MGPSHDDLYSAYTLARRYRFLSAAWTASGQRAEAERAGSKRRELVASVEEADE